jgi:hypothetical protein
MRQTIRRILLEGGAPDGVIRVLSDRVDARQLAEDKRTAVVNLARVATLRDPFYGLIELSREKFETMIKNFDADAYGQKIYLDVSHRPDLGSAGEFKRLFLDGSKFRGEVEFTELGVEAVKKRRMEYLSMDFTEDYVDPETEVKHGALMFGAALTNRPRVKRLDPVQLSFGPDERPILVSPRAGRLLYEEHTIMWKELLEKLRKQLSEMKLHEDAVKQLCEAFEKIAPQVPDETALKALAEQFAAQGKMLSESHGSGEIKLSIDVPKAAAGMTPDDVKKLMADAENERQKASKKLAEDRDKNVAAFRKALDEAEGLKELSEAQRKELSEAEDLITAEMSEDQVKKLAEHQVKLGNSMAAQAKLAQMGYESGAQGTPRISVDDSNKIKALQETIDRRLGLLDMSESRRFAITGGQLQPENKKLAEAVMAAYDREHGAQLFREHKMLAGGDGIVSDVDVPASFERTVIREALYRLVGLQFVDGGTLPFASSHLIPYSYRDTTAAGRNSTRVYEGGAIPRAGIVQASETAYPLPQKIAFEVSDELRYLTSTGRLDWNAVAENQRNATRVIGEDTEQLLFNEVLHASDEYGAVAVSNEVLDPGDDSVIDGTNEVFVLANFPVVRPRQVYDLQGNQVGSTVNPIVVEYDDAGGYDAIEEYDGTGTQAAGLYYVLDYNLGEIYITDEAGAVQTPLATHNIRVSYSYASNVYAFDTDLGADTADVHWDGFLYRFGLRKAVIEDDRYHMANFAVMSGTVMTQIEQAQQFGANSKRPGTDLAMDGNLGRIKDVPGFKTSAPGLWMGDQRAIIGERGVTRFRMLKPWTMGELENQKDSNGRNTGKKEAYGDQFIIVHTPTQLKRALTSMVLYSATARVDRVAA